MAGVVPHVRSSESSTVAHVGHIEHEYSNLSKDGNGVDITALHGMWMSQARTPYTLWPLLAGAGEVLSIPAGMLGIASILLLVG